MRYDYSKRSGKEFGRIANDYDKGRRGENIELWGRETRRLAGLTEDSMVLDLGCGTGLYTVGVGSAADCLMIGMDPVPSMLDKAREKSKDVHWVNGVAESMPFRQDIVDCIFSSQVWHHIVDKQGAAMEYGRVLKKGGAVVIRTISHSQLHRKVVFDYFPEIKQNQLEVYPSNEEFTAIFRNAGFSVVEFHEYEEERYQSVEDFVEIAEKKLWSMFRPISEEGLRKGIAKLWVYKEAHNGAPIRNDELITLVVCRK